MSFDQRQVPNLPNLGSAESRVLRQLVAWDDEYQRKKVEAKPGVYVTPPTTDKIAKQFSMGQRKMLSLLSYLELLGLIAKHRRRSAGPSGYGYNGSLYSEVHPTARARSLVARHSP
jgi:hypothetical protein